MRSPAGRPAESVRRGARFVEWPRRAANAHFSRIGQVADAIGVAGAGPAGTTNDSDQMRSGDIAFAKVGSSTLILVDSLRKFIEACRAPGEPGRRCDSHSNQRR